VTPRARDLNFTNEGGVCGTTRLLKNIAGLWLLQACRKSWAASGHDLAYETLLEGAAAEPQAFRTLIAADRATAS
jgi:rhamnulokinase